MPNGYVTGCTLGWYSIKNTYDFAGFCLPSDQSELPFIA
jgi:hypothetical protein